MIDQVETKSILPFSILIGGQLLSFIGTTLTGVAVGMWVFQQTGAVSTFALLLICTLLPAIFISPFGGVLADRFPRKPAMLMVDSLSALSNLTMLALLTTGQLQTWHLYLNAIVGGTSLGLQRPLYESVTPLMVSESKLVSVNGMVQSISGIGQLVSPAFAGVLVGFGLKWILLLDLATFVIALCCILSVQVPNPPKGEHQNSSWFTTFTEGWQFILQNPGLYNLLRFVAVRNLCFAACEVVVVPLLLIVTTTTKAGIVLSVGGLGIIIGGLLVGFLAQRRQLIKWVILAQALTGVAMLVGGVTTILPVIAIALALAFLAFPIEEAITTTIIQRKVPAQLLGRVSSVRSMMNMSATPLAMLIVAPLVDKIFEPLMRGQGQFTNLVGKVIGVGPGRGMALVLLLMGFATLLITWVGWRNSALRRVEIDMPEQKQAGQHRRMRVVAA